MKIVLSCLGAFTLFIVLVVLSVFLNAWAITTLWTWFIVPGFGVAPISKLTAIGLSMFVSLMTRETVGAGKKDERESIFPFADAVIPLLRPVVAVAFAWVVIQVLR